MVRAESSRLYIYAFVGRQQKDQDVNDRIDSIANKRDDPRFVSSILSVESVDNCARSHSAMELDLAPGSYGGVVNITLPVSDTSKRKQWSRSIIKIHDVVFELMQ